MEKKARVMTLESMLGGSHREVIFRGEGYLGVKQIGPQGCPALQIHVH